MASIYENELDAFELYHKVQESRPTSIGLPALGHALAGSAGTAISHLLLYPLDLAITRLQVQSHLRGPNETKSAATSAGIEYADLKDAVQNIYRSEGGLGAFYAGCLTDTTKSILDAFLFFLAYNLLCQRRRRAVKRLSVVDELGIGMLSGAIAKLVTTPVQQIVTRKQTAALIAARHPSDTASSSIKTIARQIYAERGLVGFWAGYSASLILTLNPALTFLFQNTLNKATLSKSNRPTRSAVLVFLMAAVSKAAASSLTYPFSVAKTRAQVQSPTSPTTKGRLPAVLTSLHQLYKTQGAPALYSGLGGEIVKGFLGHGMTMLLKQRIHVFVVAVYFLLLKVSRRWPTFSGQGDLGIGAAAASEVRRVRALVARAADELESAVGNVAETVVHGAKGIINDSP